MRREVLDRFAGGFAFERLDYDRRLRPLRGRAILFGVSVAGLLYSVGFALGYYGWQHQAVSYALFIKLVWILMFPATLVGAVVWLISSQRCVYRIRQDIREYIGVREAGDGFLWRFAPLFESLLPEDYTAKRVLQESERTPEKIDPEDYARSVQALRRQLQDGDPHRLSSDVAMRAFNNLSR